MNMVLFYHSILFVELTDFVTFSHPPVCELYPKLYIHELTPVPGGKSANERTAESNY